MRCFPWSIEYIMTRCHFRLQLRDRISDRSPLLLVDRRPLAIIHAHISLSTLKHGSRLPLASLEEPDEVRDRERHDARPDHRPHPLREPRRVVGGVEDERPPGVHCVVPHAARNRWA